MSPRSSNIPRLYALTGGIGSGKTTVASIFKKLGCAVISADFLARKAVAKGTPTLLLLSKTFGNTILTKDKRLKRKALAKAIFSQPHLRRKAEKIIHSEVRKLFRIAAKNLRKQFPSKPIIYDVPLFFEAKLPRAEFAGVIVVYAPLKVAVARAAARMNVPVEQVLARANSQLDPEKKKKLADIVIDNSSTSANSLPTKVKQVFRHL
jgi:dephospho-CoA kinase